MRLRQPIRQVELSYFGEDRIEPKELEAARVQAIAEGRSQAEEVHNAQILEFREELRALHDDILGSIQEEFSQLKNALTEAMPRMAIMLLKKTLPSVELDAEAIQKNIDTLVKKHASDEDETLRAHVSAEDFKLICKAAGAQKDTQFIKEGSVRIEPSETLTHGDCQLRTKFGLIDASIQTKIKHLEIALLGE